MIVKHWKRRVVGVLLAAGLLVGPAQAQSPQLDVPTAQDRAFALSQLWSEAKYNFVFFDHAPDVDWDRAYREALGRILGADTRETYYGVLAEFLAQLNDAHTQVDTPDWMVRPPVTLAWIEGRVLVTRIEAALDRQLPVGSTITHVDGLPAEQLLRERVYPITSASTEHYRRAVAARMALAGPPGTISVRFIRPNGSRGEMRLERAPRTPDARVIWSPAAPAWQPWRYTWLEGRRRIAYLEINTFGDSSFPEAFRVIAPELAQADGLIIDIRRNSGGNTAHAFAILDLIASARVPGPTARARENRSNYRAYGVEEYVRGTAWREMDEPWFHDPAPGPKFNGPVVLLTSNFTFSAAEDFTIFTSNLSNVTRMGQTTAGSTGNSIRVELPGGLVATICAERHAWPDGRDYVGVGIPPHIAVEPRIADIRAGRDTVLEAAQRHLEREFHAN